MDWIDKNHLDTFAKRTDAQDLLPALVYDLILATSETPADARFLFGQAGRVRGFDGILVSRGAPPYVPPGRSVWEFGCEPTFKAKAAKDLAKRTRQVPPAERQDLTFVFVTPRTYDTPRQSFDDWEAKLGKGKGWKEVRVIDGAKLKQWLAIAPGVAAHWAADGFGTYPPGVASTDEWWSEYTSGCLAPITEELLLAGRAEQQRAVLEKLSTLEANRIELSADSPDEALAFAVAVLRKAAPEVRAVIRARSLVLRTAEAATDLVRRGKLAKGLVFFPLSPAATKAGLLSLNGPTVIPSGRAQGRTSSYTQLGRPPRHVFAEALVSSGQVDRPRAAQIATGCGCSVTVLARLEPSGAVVPPSWAVGPERWDLVPALLVGAWDASNEADREVLASLSGASSYEEYETRIQHLCAADDPPLERAGPIWKVRAPMDAFVRLGQFASGPHLDRFKAVCLDVLGERDLNLDLGTDALLLAGRGLRRSSWLREGLATSLLLAATMHEAAAFGASLGSAGGTEVWVAGIVRDLPGLGTDARLMASLQGALPLLAEAAPIPFVEAVAQLLEGGADAVAPLFRERTAFITPDARHTNLLWALETLAWDPDLLPRVAVLLTRLAAVDPGGKLTNRPVNSLREIFLPWLPQTNANLPKRLGVIEGVVRTDSGVGWDLCLRLLPEFHGTSIPTARPRIREAVERGDAALWDEQSAVHRAAARHLLRLVGTDVVRWSSLIKHLPDLPREEHDAAVGLLDGVLAALNPSDRERLWRALRDMTARHAGFQDADWALRGPPLNRLLALVTKWTSEDPVARAVPLFAEHLPELILSEGEGPLTDERLEELRMAAVRLVFGAEGDDGLLRLADALPDAWNLVRFVGDVVSSPERALRLCRLALGQGSEKLEGFAAALSRTAHQRFGAQWKRLLVSSRDSMPPTSSALLLLGLPDDADAWDFVASFGGEVERAYWSRKSPWFLRDTEPTLVERAVRQFVQAGQAVAALLAAERAAGLSSDLVLAALDAAIPEINEASERLSGSVLYSIERVFEGLLKRPDVNRRELAKREFAYLPVLSQGGRSRKPLALFEAMATDASLFVSLLTLVFHPASGEHVEPTEEKKKQAQAAFRALESFHLVPGQSGAELDGATLLKWVREVLRLTAEADRAKIGAQYAGKVMAHSPKDSSDGAWPARAVRDVLEEVGSEEMERGIIIERFNMRGVYSKSPYDGGAAERALAAEARGWADTCAAWPRTAAMLARIAEDWERYAEQEDVRARLNLMND